MKINIRITSQTDKEIEVQTPSFLKLENKSFTKYLCILDDRAISISKFPKAFNNDKFIVSNDYSLDVLPDITKMVRIECAEFSKIITEAVSDFIWDRENCIKK